MKVSFRDLDNSSLTNCSSVVDGPVNRLLLYIATAVQIADSTNLTILTILLNSRRDNVDHVLSSKLEANISINLSSLNSKCTGTSSCNLSLVGSNHLYSPLSTAVPFDVPDDGFAVFDQWGLFACLVLEARVLVLAPFSAGRDITWEESGRALGG